jgi:type II secretory pathway pseudopilin PulG
VRYSVQWMPLHRRARGVTIIEAMIVVLIVGVLAMLAVVAYRRWVRTSYVAEAQDMVGNIRSAEEAFASENGVYLDVSGCLGANCSYPLVAPSNVKTAWGGACGSCPNVKSDGTPITWASLNVSSGAPVIFGYSVIADQAQTPASRIGTIKVNGQAIDYSAMANGAPWYFIEADANVSGDKVNYTHVYGMSGTNQIYVDGAGN